MIKLTKRARESAAELAKHLEVSPERAIEIALEEAVMSCHAPIHSVVYFGSTDDNR